MGRVLRNIFGLYPGEEKNALCFSLLGFLWALAVSSAIKFSDALFLTHVGAEALPTVYILTSSSMIAISLLFLNIFNLIETHRLYAGTIASGICFYLFALVCLWNPSALFTPYLWYGLRIFGYVFLAVMLTCFWTFVDHYYHLQDAKRHYSIFTSAVFLGMATAGLILRSGAILFTQWLFFIVALLAASIGLILYIAKNFKSVHNELELDTSSNNEDSSILALIRTLFSSRFTLTLVTGAFLTYLILSFTEYNYMASFEKHFLTSETQISDSMANPQLKCFMGQCMLGVSLISMFIGLFVYSRIIRKFGVTSLLAFTPCVLLITFLGWNLSDALIFPMLGYFVDEGSIYVIEDSNLNLMINGVPSKVKYKIRLLIEAFFEPFGMLVSGLLLTIPNINSKLVGLGFAGLIFIFSLFLKRGYLKAITTNLMENAIHFERPIKNWLNKGSEKRFLKIFKRPDLQSQVFALEGLVHIEHPENFLPLLDKMTAKTKLCFIKLLKNSPLAEHPLVLDYLRLWTMEDTQVEEAANLYLAKLGLYSGFTKSKKGLQSSDANEICLALEVLSFEPTDEEQETLIEFLDHHNPEIAKQAALSLAECADPRFGKTLIKKLGDPNLRAPCLKALERIGDKSLVRELIRASHHFLPKERRQMEELLIKMGAPIVPTLIAITKETSNPDLCRLLAGRVLGRVAPTKLHDILYDLMAVEIRRAHFYRDHQLTIQEVNPTLDLSLLAASLESSYHSVLDFIIQILGVAGELENCELLSRLIRSPKPKLRSQVIETLEKTCDISIFRLLDPLIVELPMEQKLLQIKRSGFVPDSLETLLDKLSHSPLPLDHVIAATLKHRYNTPNWKKSLRVQMEKNETIFHNFALELLES